MTGRCLLLRFLLTFGFDSEDNQTLKTGSDHIILQPNTSNFVKNTRLRVVFPTLISVIRNVLKHGIRVWCIIWNTCLLLSLIFWQFVRRQRIKTVSLRSGYMKTKPSFWPIFMVLNQDWAKKKKKNTFDGEANKNITRLVLLHPTAITIPDYVSSFPVNSLFNFFDYFQHLFGLSLFFPFLHGLFST